MQATSAYLFGFHGWSLLLPQALAGVLSVALLYHLVGRSFGPVAGLLAALALALTPISVATNRHNNLEILLVLTVLLAAWAFIGVALVLTFPMWITVNILGTPDNGVILVSYIGSFLMAGAFLAIGSAISALTKNQVIAFIISATLCFLLVMSGLELVLNVLRAWTPSFLVSAVASMSFLSHFDRVTRGVLDLSGLVFYLSLIAFALFANRIFVELKKAD